jgi:hypothetical protein
MHSNYLDKPAPNSIGQKPSWESNSRSESQEISGLFLEPEGSLPCLQEPATGPYPEPN